METLTDIRGFRFTRHDDGDVSIVVDPDTAREHEITLNPDEWAHLVAAMSARGDNPDSVRDALKLHRESWTRDHPPEWDEER